MYLELSLLTLLNLEVTETEPGFKGDTATEGATKPATVETGATIKVPLFIDIGDVIRIDTRTGRVYRKSIGVILILYFVLKTGGILWDM